ncbi:MAG: hypothetical protein ACE5GW_02080 [Planctomycetota bacterium]
MAVGAEVTRAGPPLDDEARRPRARRILLAFTGILLLGGGIRATSLWMRHDVDRRLALEEGEWDLRLEALPNWLPGGFRGALGALDDLPATVPLRSARWRERLRNALEANPWIAHVSGLERHGGQIRFEATFPRPVVGVRADGGFLLVDSSGRVIDFQEGERLDRSWGIPEYLALDGATSRRSPGALLEEEGQGEEYRQLFALLRTLWEARVFETWPGAIPEISCEQLPAGDRRWRLILAHGTMLHWGRSPASELPSVLPLSAKLRNLRSVLEVWPRLEGAVGVMLWSGEDPMVTVGSP